MTIQPDRLTALINPERPARLGKGRHTDPQLGLCLLEAAAWVAGEPHTDHPECVSPALAAFGRALNDALPEERRQELLPLVPMLIGTVDPVLDERDGLRCEHWFVTVWTPTWLDLTPTLAGHAAALRALGAPESWDDVEAWRPFLTAARDAAWDATWDAARDAAWDALAPTVQTLQTAAIDLYRDMVTARGAVAVLA